MIVVISATLGYFNKTSLSRQDSFVRNVDNYLPNDDYYQKLSGKHQFTQMDNLRRDRLSSPRFHPTTGKSIMYLRTQYHMPDFKGSTTTLHWVDIQTNKTIQLTKPIWGIHDGQVIYTFNANEKRQTSSLF